MKVFVFLLFVTSCTFGQNEYPRNYFVSPLEIPLQLSGNFGELRPNHFHAGFDLKTNKKKVCLCMLLLMDIFRESK